MSLLQKLKAGKKNVKIIKFPGEDVEVALQVLTGQEIQDAVFAAQNLFKKADMEVITSTFDAYEDERTTQILFRALRDPEDTKNSFATTVGELRAMLTNEEKNILVIQYMEFEKECSPNFSELPEAEFEELWEALKKNPDRPLNDLSLGMLTGLLHYLASRPQRSPKDNGST